MKILIAEDNPICRRQLETLLTKWGYEVVITSDGEQAWRVLSQEQAPELVILDWMMPGLDGTEVCRKIRESKVSRPAYIILLTAKGNKEDLIEGFKAGADDYVKKPFDVEELRLRVQVGARIIELQRRLTDRAKELEESHHKLKQTQARLIQQEKLASIGQLAAGIAHELNNPLGFITSNFLTLKNYLKIIEDYLARLEELVFQLKASDHSPLREDIQKIEQFKKQSKLNFILQDLGDLFTESAKGFDRITSIVQSLRSFSRVDQINKIENYDIHRAIEDTLIVARNEIKYVAEVEKQFSEVSLIECRGNEINQVLLNIILNAAQAIKSQNRSKLGKITIKTYQTGDYVYCEISDDGPGIEEKIQSRIFEPFFTTKPVGQGTGLGLNISYDIIVNKHKGDLTMKSVVGKGTTFTIKLPIRSPLKKTEEIEAGGSSI